MTASEAISIVESLASMRPLVAAALSLDAADALVAEIKKLQSALGHIKVQLGYGIYGCPTDGEYHARTYAEAYKIAKDALMPSEVDDRMPPST